MIEVRYIKTLWGNEAVCKKCGSDVDWQECEQCDPDYPGYSHHDCGEDTCCCLDPEPNAICDTCDGAGGWWICPSCDGEKEESP
jgi:hypothetical protein